ncbi:MAG: C_GCAxxG_C_C family protein [Clostridia bacterium]|nr:C_GCAxxG_C_C family protein [Clostridia bacterium]
MAELKRTERVEKAIALHLAGCNCAQAVALAFADLTDLNENQILRAASDFGGGVSGTHGTCGTVSAIALVLGLTRGYEDITDTDHKHRLYAEGRQLIEQFRAEFGTVTCAELVGEVARKYFDTPHPLVEEPAPKPCSPFVAYAAALLDRFFEENPVK